MKSLSLRCLLFSIFSTALLLAATKGLTGELVAEHWLTNGFYKDCPKVDELIAKSGDNHVTVQSNVIKLTTEQDMYEVELTLPFPQCEKAKE